MYNDDVTTDGGTPAASSMGRTGMYAIILYITIDGSALFWCCMHQLLNKLFEIYIYVV